MRLKNRIEGRRRRPREFNLHLLRIVGSLSSSASATPPPPETAFETLSRLKPTGFIILTVPYTLDPVTIEHFSDIGPLGIAEVDRQTVLVSRSGENGHRVFDHLTFHGGPGFTLEMRVYSEADLRAKLAAAGLPDVRS